MKAEMMIFMAQPLFSWLQIYSFRNEGFFCIDVSTKSLKSVLFELKL